MKEGRDEMGRKGRDGMGNIPFLDRSSSLAVTSALRLLRCKLTVASRSKLTVNNKSEEGREGKG